MQKCRVLLTALLVVGIMGCEGGPKDTVDRVVVSGKVTKGGQPLSKGRIMLYPSAGTKAPTSGAEIKNGEYRIDAKGGVPVGTHRVEIHQFEVKAPEPGRPALEVENNVLPEQFNTNSKFELTVDAGEPIVKDIDLDKDFAAAP